MTRYRLVATVLVTLAIVFADAALDNARLSAAGAVEPSDDPPQLFRVYFSSHRQVSELAAAYDVWEVSHAQKVALVLLSPTQAAELRASGQRVELDVDKTALLSPPLISAQVQSSGIPGYACYRTVAETYADMAALAAAHPTLVDWVDIGDSWQKVSTGGSNGRDLRALILTNRAKGGEKFRFVVIAAIHARELSTAELAARFAEELVAGYGHDPDVTWLLDYGEVHIVPVMNPDGRAIAEQLVYWRKNINSGDGCANSNPLFSSYGVDLNRNSSFKWAQCEGGRCSSANACAATFRGRAVASEPETQAIEAYVRSLFPDQRGEDDEDAAPAETTGLFISLHSYSELVLYPWGWRAAPSANHGQLATLAHKFGYSNGYTVCQSGAPGCLYQTDGTTDDWAYGELGIAAYTFELGTTFFQDCTDFETDILDSNMAALRFGFKAARRPFQTPAGPETLNAAVDPVRVHAGAAVSLTAQVDDRRTSLSHQAIAAARYTVDAPSWISDTIAQPLPALDGSFDTPVESVGAVIDTQGWSLGRHIVFLEGQDGNGAWGVPSAIFVDIVEAGHDVSASPAALSSTIRAGQVTSYSIVITNSGVISDVYTIAVEGNRWPVDTPSQTGLLEPAASTTVDVTVHGSDLYPASDSAYVVVTSARDLSRSATVEIVTHVEGYFLYLPLVGSYPW